VSFITSIATGIVTVTLLDQAPPGVTQTINRVVERTVEKVVPGQAASVITKETTVVVKEENLIISSVEKNAKSIFRIGLGDEDGVYDKTLGVGVVLSNDGLIATDYLNLGESKTFLVKNGNKTYSADLATIDPVSGLAFLRVIQPKEVENAFKFSKPSFGNTGNLKLGQTVIAIGGLSSNVISTGVISKLEMKPIDSIVSTDEGKKEPEKSTTENVTEKPIIEVLSAILSTAPTTTDYSGGPLVDVDGFLIGLNMKRKDGDFSIPIEKVLDISLKKLETTTVAEKK